MGPLSAHPTFKYANPLLCNSATAATPDGTLASFDAATGRPNWRIKTGGRLTAGTGAEGGVVAVGTGKGEVLEVIPRLLITGRRVTGSSFGGVKGRTQVPQLVERWLAGEIDVESLLSHRLELDDVNRGFELMEAQDGIRSVIRFS